MTTSAVTSSDDLPAAARPAGRERPARRGVNWKFVAGPVVLIGLVVGFWLLVPRHWVTDAIDWVRSLGPSELSRLSAICDAFLGEPDGGASATELAKVIILLNVVEQEGPECAGHSHRSSI